MNSGRFCAKCSAIIGTRLPRFTSLERAIDAALGKLGAEPVPGPASEERPAGARRAESWPVGGEPILVVDDNPGMSGLIKFHLECDGPSTRVLRAAPALDLERGKQNWLQA